MHESKNTIESAWATPDCGISKQNYEYRPDKKRTARALESDELTSIKPWQTKGLNP
jgi:hypothetical protein